MVRDKRNPHTTNEQKSWERIFLEYDNDYTNPELECMKETEANFTWNKIVMKDI